MDAFRFQPADHIDPAYGRRLRQALEKGLEAIAYDVAITTRQICLNRRLPCEFQPSRQARPALWIDITHCIS